MHLLDHTRRQSPTRPILKLEPRTRGHLSRIGRNGAVQAARSLREHERARLALFPGSTAKLPVCLRDQLELVVTRIPAGQIRRRQAPRGAHGA